MSAQLAVAGRYTLFGEVTGYVGHLETVFKAGKYIW